MGRGSSGLGRSKSDSGANQNDTVFSNLVRIPLPGGGFNLMSNGKRVGMIDSYGGEYRYIGIFQGVNINKKASVVHPVYVQNLRRSFTVNDWDVLSVWKASTGRTVVTGIGSDGTINVILK